ncbi:hypothetical protein [Mycolicibacterium conceptionense]|uniref:hypothetical protein n=1 Tax=Mycolicibacterium conceptionense TaxID=451644 RepID=UPI000661FB49|nr:hypothetical protein [Mycolicibacterium conceptionense]
MGIFDRLHRSRSAVDLPKLALSPLHEPVRSLAHFTDAPLDPIPLGVGDGAELLNWNPSLHGDHLLIVNTTGRGGTVAARNVVEQCRTRGWQVIAADGKFDLLGLENEPNVSFLGLPAGGLSDPAIARSLAAVAIAHRIFTERTNAARGGYDVAAHPVLLALTELAGLMQAWRSFLPEEDVNSLHGMLDEMLRGGGPVRCHVLLLPASGHRWQVPIEWGRLCTQLLLGDLHEREIAPYTDESSVRRLGRSNAAGRIPGRGVLVYPGEERTADDARPIQTLYTYAPGSDPDSVDGWAEFKAQVSDATPALHPQLRLDAQSAGFPDIAACTWTEIRRLPLVAEQR